MRHCILILTTVFLAACAPTRSPDNRPNILWIVAEDLGPYIPAFGDSTVSTPNLDRLSAEGIRFPNLFSPSGVCAPSRAAILTGLYPNRFGAGHMRTMSGPRPEGVPFYEAVPPPGVLAHAEHLRREGYYTTNNAKEDYQLRIGPAAWDESSRHASYRDRAPGQPFFAIYNIFVTHESQIWRKQSDPWAIDPEAEVAIPPYLPETDSVRADVRRMYSNIVEMDRRVGALLDSLEHDGLLDSTIIFWYTDHGGPLPRQKRMVFDSGLRVPLIVRFPDGRRAGDVDDRLLSFVDLKPTLLSLARIAPPEGLDGRAFLGPYAAEEARQYVFGAGDRFDGVYDGVRAARDQRFKYLRHLDTTRGYYVPVAYRTRMPSMRTLLRRRDAGTLDSTEALWFRETRPREELFDAREDPHEVRDLAADPAYRDVLERLRGVTERWVGEIGDTGLMPETTLVRTLWPGGVQPVTAPPEETWKDGLLVLASATDGASIGYQLHDPETEPGDRWAVYTDPVAVPDSLAVTAVAHRLGWAWSASVTIAPRRGGE